MKRTLASKVSQLQTLEARVQHLEIKLAKQQKESQTLLHNGARRSAVKRASPHSIDGRRFYRTCKQLHQAEPLRKSGIYWIDPDGDGFGDPIQVHCDMRTGHSVII